MKELDICIYHIDIASLGEKSHHKQANGRHIFTEYEMLLAFLLIKEST